MIISHISIGFFTLLSTILNTSDYTYDIKFVQNKDTVSGVNNVVVLQPNTFKVIVTLPLNMQEFDDYKFSSLDYFATKDSSLINEIMTRRSLKDALGSDYFPFSFDVHNSRKIMTISNVGYSFWSITPAYSKENNVSSYKIINDQIVAEVEIDKFAFSNNLNETKLKINNASMSFFLYFEASDREGKIIGKRSFFKVIIK